ncbi:MAG: hypothetical protein ACI83B_003359 [Sediminicola sp.]|jgi:hypothetical protein
MRKYLILIITLTFFSTQAQKTPEVVNEILEYSHQINQRLKELKRVDEETFEFSTDGGEIIKFYDGEQLVKMSLNLNGETGLLNRNYCLKNGELVYVFDEEFRYNVPYYIDSAKATSMGLNEWFDPEKTQLFMSQFYFQKEELVWWVKDEKPVNKDHPDFKKKEKLFMDELVELK